MPTLEAVLKPVATIEVEQSLAEAASIMRRDNIGALVVTDGNRIAGIVTDRDIVVNGLARGELPDARVDSVMSADLVCIDAGADIEDVLAVFGSHAFRRLPVVKDDELAGMITVDDLLVLLSQELGELARPVLGEALFRSSRPDVPAVRG